MRETNVLFVQEASEADAGEPVDGGADRQGRHRGAQDRRALHCHPRFLQVAIKPFYENTFKMSLSLTKKYLCCSVAVFISLSLSSLFSVSVSFSFISLSLSKNFVLVNLT